MKFLSKIRNFYENTQKNIPLSFRINKNKGNQENRYYIKHVKSDIIKFKLRRYMIVNCYFCSQIIKT